MVIDEIDDTDDVNYSETRGFTHDDKRTLLEAVVQQEQGRGYQVTYFTSIVSIDHCVNTKKDGRTGKLVS
jgi:hypothetical protein